MNATDIKFKTIEFINGLKYISQEQVESLGYIMCHNLGIDKNEANFSIIKEAVKSYFNLMNNRPRLID